MKYFLDTEFLEYFVEDNRGKKFHTMDLLQIAIIREDGKTFYALNSEFDLESCWLQEDDFVKEKILKKIFNKYVDNNMLTNFPFNLNNCKIMLNGIGISKSFMKEKINSFFRNDDNPEFYAYFADYDWVLFCSLYGRMIDLPNKFPKYCKDLKQILDYTAELVYPNMETKKAIKILKETTDFPIQNKDEEHDARNDANWNLKLFNYLQEFHEEPIW
jgi:hypothetical protein